MSHKSNVLHFGNPLAFPLSIKCHCIRLSGREIILTQKKRKHAFSSDKCHLPRETLKTKTKTKKC